MDQLSSVLNNISNDELVTMEREAKDYALSQGIGFKLKTNPLDTISMAPITLFPSPLPKNHFQTGKRLQPVINELSHKIAYNHHFLSESLAKTIQVDDFTRKLFDIYSHVVREGLAQDVSLGLFRADYMVNEREGSSDMKQVEVNNISSSFAGLAPAVRRVHRHVLSKYTAIEDLDNRLPENRSPELLAEGLVQAFNVYNRPNAAVLVVIESIVVNVFDQRLIEFSVSKSRPDIKIIRRSFEDLRHTSRLGSNKELIVDGKHEVAVVYYRTAYAPDNYAGQEDWDVRLLLERSKAIKCPSIQYHITGCKKIQQIIANQTVLEKFIANESDVKDLMRVFTGLWGLEVGKSGDNAIDMAVRDPMRFVLKPQREGGGNNYFGEEVALKLNEIRNTKDRESYILMELIRAPKLPNHILLANKSVADNDYQPRDILCEFGVFGAVMGNGSHIMHNTDAGHLIRSKPYGTNEGGVAAGFGALDSPFLY